MNEQATIIAIVDDDPAVRHGTSGLLRSLGYVTLDFSSAEEFLRSGHVNGVSCLITDVRMPGMSGIELFDRLIAEGQKMPTIFITAFLEQSVRTRAIEAGAIGFLTKPFAQQSLLECINSALRTI